MIPCGLALFCGANCESQANGGEHWQRPDLTAEAIRLTRAVHAKSPDDAEVAGLLALMLLTEARRAARSGPQGEVVPLDLWDRAMIAEGVRWSVARCRAAPSVPINCRRRSRRCMTKRPTRRRRIGRRSWRRTQCCYGWRRDCDWWRSWRSGTVCVVITVCTQYAAIWKRWRATGARPERPIKRRPGGPRACPSATICWPRQRKYGAAKRKCNHGRVRWNLY
jgi:hypothetical protein